MSRKIRVLIVDDSALIRQLLTELLSADHDIEVVGAAHDPFHARDLIKQLHPDVLTLDVEMPRMNGLQFLENLMRLHPLPVVMVSSLTTAGSDAALRALELGAFEIVAKPQIGVGQGLRDAADHLRSVVKAAANSGVKPRLKAAPRLVSSGALKVSTDFFFVLGASTGGTEALRNLLQQLPADAPGVVLVQHIPAAFSGPFAERLDRSCAMQAAEAFEGARIAPGQIWVAPGGRHLKVVRDGARYRLTLGSEERINGFAPSVDVLFNSAVEAAGSNLAGGLLTGMGHDGAQGLLRLKQSGAYTCIQDEASSVVWGMPGAAFKLGAADAVLPLDQVAERLMDAARRHQGRLSQASSGR